MARAGRSRSPTSTTARQSRSNLVAQLAVGGDKLAEQAVTELLKTVCGSAAVALGRRRARELIEMQLTALERGQRV